MLPFFHCVSYSLILLCTSKSIDYSSMPNSTLAYGCLNLV